MTAGVILVADIVELVAKETSDFAALNDIRAVLASVSSESVLAAGKRLVGRIDQLQVHGASLDGTPCSSVDKGRERISKTIEEIRASDEALHKIAPYFTGRSNN